MNDTPGYVKNLKKESVVQSVINCLTDAMLCARLALRFRSTRT